MDYDANKLLDGLPLGSYVLDLDSKGNLVPVAVYEDNLEWLPGEMPFTIPQRLAA